MNTVSEKNARQAVQSDQASKPSYLGLLNAIAVGEARADRVLRTWCDVTADETLATVLNLVAIREHEHAAAFTKRLCELGFGVQESDSDAHQADLAFAASAAPDREKFRVLLKIEDPADDADPFDQLFTDKSIDARTGALLGRYIAEERDSGRRLRAACAALSSPPGDPVLEEIAARLDRLTETLEELKALNT